MNNQKFFIGTGAMVLSIAAVFAGRASVKSVNVGSIYVSTVGGGCKQLSVVISSTFTTGGSGFQATLKTQTGTSPNIHRRVWGTNTCGTGVPKAVHFHG